MITPLKVSSFPPTLLILWLVVGLGHVSLPVQAQVQTNGFQWATGAGGSLNDSAAGLAVDRFTNAVVVGTYSNSATFGSFTLTNAGNTDICIAKYSPTGSVIWARRAGGVQEDGGSSVAIDTNANIYTGGFFRAQATFGDASLKTRGAASALDGYLCKWDPTGKIIWAQQAGGPNDDRVFGLTIDPFGNCIAVGTFQGTATFGASTVLQGSSTLVTEAFVAKYAPDGTLAWAKRFFAQRGFAAFSVATDAAGNPYVAGEFIGATLVGTNSLTSAGDRDAVVMKLSTAGEVLWASRLGGTDPDSAKAIGVDAQGAAYVGGYFSERLQAPTGTILTQGRRDFYLARFTSDGTLDWIKTGGGTLDDSVTSIAVTKQGSIYAAGGFTVSMLVSGLTLNSAGNQDAFLARYSSGGDLQWLARGGGSGTASDVANAVATTSSGEVFFAGDFSGTADFGTNQLSTGSALNRDLFLARRSTFAPVILQSPTNVVVVVGGAFTMTVTAALPGPFTYQWYFNSVALTNETNSVLTRATTTLDQAGFYSVEVFNSEASIRSQPAELRVDVKLQVLPNGSGEVFWDPAQSSYQIGSTVQFLAIPAADAFFAGWSGDLIGTDNPASLILDSNKTVVAVFGSRRLTLDLVGFGAVTPSPEQDLYNPGDKVTLVAEPADFFKFIGWTDGLTANPRVVTIGVSNSYVALFTNTVPVETIVESGASRTAPVGTPGLRVDGIFQPSGPLIRGDGAQIALFSTFTNAVILYSLDGSEPTRLYADSFRITSSAQIRAVAYTPDFVSRAELKSIVITVLPTFLLRVTTPGGGTLAVEPVKLRYLSNDVVTLTATATNGWSFLGWSGDILGTNPVVQVTMTHHQVIEAIFGTSLSLSNLGSGQVIAQPDIAAYPYGATVRLTALPASNNAFIAWGEAASGAVNPLSFSISRPNPTVRGLFLPNTTDLPVVVQVIGSGSVVVFPRLNTYTNGQSLLAIATPDAKQQFLGWTGDAQAATNRLTLVVTQSMRIQAQFTHAPSLVITQCFGNEVGLSGLRVQVNSVPGATVELERGSSLGAWSPWTRLTNLWGRLFLRDPSLGEGESGFRRAHE